MRYKYEKLFNNTMIIHEFFFAIFIITVINKINLKFSFTEKKINFTRNCNLSSVILK